MNTEMASCFKVLSDPNRLEILELLLKGETCGCTLIDKLPVSQPTLSYHLKMMTKVGITNSTRDGNWIKHVVNKNKINEIILFLEQLRDTEEEQCSL